MNDIPVDKISNKRLLDIPTQNNDKWTYKEIRFIDEYMTCGNACEAYRRAFPDASEESVKKNASTLFRRRDIASEIKRRSAELTKSAIAETNDILTFYTKIMNGEVQDQFGLDATLKDRLAAAKELLKYRTDVLERVQEDNTLTINLVKK